MSNTDKPEASAATPTPNEPRLDDLREAAAKCTACPLYAKATQALFGRAFRVTRDRGRPIPSRWAACAMATVHPSALLRAPDEETRHRETAHFIADLKAAAAMLERQ